MAFTPDWNKAAHAPEAAAPAFSQETCPVFGLELPLDFLISALERLCLAPTGEDVSAGLLRLACVADEYFGGVPPVLERRVKSDTFIEHILRSCPEMGEATLSAPSWFEEVADDYIKGLDDPDEKDEMTKLRRYLTLALRRP